MTDILLQNLIDVNLTVLNRLEVILILDVVVTVALLYHIVRGKK